MRFFYAIIGTLIDKAIPRFDLADIDSGVEAVAYKSWTKDYGWRVNERD